MITPKIFLNEYSSLKIKYGYKPDELKQNAFPAEKCVFASVYGDVHFYYCMN